MNKRTHYIYKITNLENNMSYVGQRLVPENYTIETDPYMGGGTLIKRAIKKHGKENFKKEILEICYSRKEADRLEEFYFNKEGVYTNPEKFYNIGLAGQFWRNENHSEFMSNIQKKFYSDEEKKCDRLEKTFQTRMKTEAKKHNMTLREWMEFKTKKEETKNYNLKINSINRKIKKAHNDYYLFMRKQTADLRKEFYNERTRQKNLLTWKEKKHDLEFLEAVRKGKENIDYKVICKTGPTGPQKNKRKSNPQKHNSIIYDILKNNKMYAKDLECLKTFERYLSVYYKNKSGLERALNKIFLEVSKIDNIKFNDLISEAKEKYKHLYE